MPPKNRIIIDTDPGVDDVLAMLLALSASSSELETLLISVTYGNVDALSCLRNVVAIFHILDKELAWRKSQSLPLGYEGITHFHPIVAVGADEPLQDRIESADYFHGIDGLAGIHGTHPHLSPSDGWRNLFTQPPTDSLIASAAKAETPIDTPTTSFVPSHLPSHKEILRLLASNPPDTITLIALGPCTNYALAAAEDPTTFLRCKELIVMGGTVSGPGNVTPVAEFNIYADPYAAAAVFALTSPKPESTMPRPMKGEKAIDLKTYPSSSDLGERRLKLRLMSLDITEHHGLTRKQVREATEERVKMGSPLAHWLVTFMTPMLDKMERLHTGHEGDETNLALHDPLCIWYVLTQHLTAEVERDGDGEGEGVVPIDKGWCASAKSPEDIRVETRGQWSRGMTVGDTRSRRRRDSDGEVPSDRGNWLGRESGNRVFRMLGSPGRDKAGAELMRRIFG
jgi:inosine-uridine nucleoside N-ribohydrolase